MNNKRDAKLVLYLDEHGELIAAEPGPGCKNPKIEKGKLPIPKEFVKQFAITEIKAVPIVLTRINPGCYILTRGGWWICICCR